MAVKRMTAAAFSAWVSSMKETRGWSQARCSRELGSGVNQIKRWRDHGAPLYIALACASISYGLPPSDNLGAEVERLRGIIEKSDSARYLEAVQRACDERLTELKHQAREWQNRAEAAERQLAEQPNHPDLDRLLRESFEAVSRLTPDVRRAIYEAQQRSWVVGEMMLKDSNMTREQAERVYDRVICRESDV